MSRLPPIVVSGVTKLASLLTKCLVDFVLKVVTHAGVRLDSDPKRIDFVVPKRWVVLLSSRGYCAVEVDRRQLVVMLP